MNSTDKASFNRVRKTADGFTLMEDENKHFLDFLRSEEGEYLLWSAAEHSDCSHASEGPGLATSIEDNENVLLTYLDCIDYASGAAEDMQTLLERYLEQSGYFDDMLEASKRALSGSLEGWSDLVDAAYYCQHSKNRLRPELRRNLSALKIKGTHYPRVCYEIRQADARRRTKASAEHHNDIVDFIAVTPADEERMRQGSYIK